MAERDAPARDEPAPANPRTATFLAGRDAAEKTLLAALASGRCAHGWLLTGPRGVGKATLAYRTARFLLSDRTTVEPDMFGEAPASMDVGADDPVAGRIAAGAHLNLHVLEIGTNPDTGRKRTEIVVDDARAATRFLRNTASDGGWRVVIVDAVDDLNNSAANALLKILEEPPNKSLLLLVNHSRGSIPSTLRSRCRTLAMPPLADDDAARVLEALRPDIDGAERADLLLLAKGSPGSALALAAAGGLALRRDLAALLEHESGADATPCLRFAERFAKADAAAQFRVAGDLIGGWLAERCREAAADGAKAKRWAALWRRTADRFSRAESRNLDRQQVVLDTLFAIRGGA